MMKSVLLAASSALALAACATAGTQASAATAAEETTMNTAAELAQPWNGPYGGVPPWDRVSAEKFPAAFDQGLAELEAEIAAIASTPEAPTFDNTIAAMERSGRTLSRVSDLFGVMTSNLNNPDVQAVDAEYSPKITAAFDAITFNGPLFRRIEAVHAARATLEPDQKRLVEITYDQFVNRGARLDAAGKARLGEINQRLSVLFSEFGNRVLADENSFIQLSESDLGGLSDDYVASARAAAQARGLQGAIVVNTRSSVDPFLAMSTRRDLRERVWKAFKNRGDNGGDTDTNGLIAEIVSLRAERAALLGFPSHAHWRMSDTMARDPAKAMELMERVWTPAVARVREEVADMTRLARAEGLNGAFEPWDYNYYAEKVRQEKFDLDEAELKPYFELGNMTRAMFYVAEQLYGLQFKEITGQVPAFHADVQVYEVTDKATGAHRGLFYADNFARQGKRSGAWMTTYRLHETFDGTRTPLTSNNNNFVQGAPGDPVLISLDDAQTLFHEFGHALHYLLSTARYPGLATTPRDFVEYPSQVMEHWVLSEPILDKFARHYQTRERMPQALLDKVNRAKTFNQGYATVEYLSAALVDMKMHASPTAPTDIDAFERETLQAIGMPREIAMRHRLPQFLHLFSSDAYSAGYYSYLWSEVMDADTWRAFEESGDVFDPTLAAAMRYHILAPGNSSDRSEAFRALRGRDPDVKALLAVRGFPTGE